jgi:prophage regulatory protein
MRCGDEVIEYMSVNQLGFSIGWKDLPPNYRIMRLPEVKTMTGLSRSTIYFRIAEGTFPKQISLGGRAVGWLENEIQEWLQRQIQTSRQSDGNNGSLN